MTPDDFQITGHQSYGSRSPRKDNTHPVFTLHHPQDQCFTATVCRAGGSHHMWHVKGRVGTFYTGYTTRKRKAMWQAIHALQAAYERCQPQSPTP